MTEFLPSGQGRVVGNIYLIDLSFLMMEEHLSFFIPLYLFDADAQTEKRPTFAVMTDRFWLLLGLQLQIDRFTFLFHKKIYQSFQRNRSYIFKTFFSSAFYF